MKQYTALQLLQRGRKLLLQPRGWCKKKSIVVHKDGTFAFCATGALHGACFTPSQLRKTKGFPHGGYRCDTSAARALLDRATKIVAQADVAVVSYNDDPKRRLKEVIAVYDKAIELAKAG